MRPFWLIRSNCSCRAGDQSPACGVVYSGRFAVDSSCAVVHLGMRAQHGRQNICRPTKSKVGPTATAETAARQRRMTRTGREQTMRARGKLYVGAVVCARLPWSCSKVRTACRHPPEDLCTWLGALPHGAGQLQLFLAHSVARRLCTIKQHHEHADYVLSNLALILISTHHREFRP